MEFSSYRFKSFAITLGSTLWYFIISSMLGVFSVERIIVFVIIVFIVTQIFSRKLSRTLDALAVYNTKLFLGILFVTVMSLNGIFFRVLRIDLLRLKNQYSTYWLEMEPLRDLRVLKQY